MFEEVVGEESPVVRLKLVHLYVDVVTHIPPQAGCLAESLDHLQGMFSVSFLADAFVQITYSLVFERFIMWTGNVVQI